MEKRIQNSECSTPTLRETPKNKVAGKPKTNQIIQIEWEPPKKNLGGRESK